MSLPDRFYFSKLWHNERRAFKKRAMALVPAEISGARVMFEGSYTGAGGGY